MLTIDETGKIKKWVAGQGEVKVNSLDDVTEKELLQTIAAKLHSIRGMILFFTVLTVISMIIIVFVLFASSR